MSASKLFSFFIHFVQTHSSSLKLLLFFYLLLLLLLLLRHLLLNDGEVSIVERIICEVGERYCDVLAIGCLENGLRCLADDHRLP